MEELTNREARTLEEKQVILEINFKERIAARGISATTIEPEIWDKVVLEYLKPLWHDPEKDEVEFLIFYSDKSYFCQRKRSKVDFNTKTKYWASYIYSEATNEQAWEVYEFFDDLTKVQKEVSKNIWVEEGKKIYDQAFYYEAKWVKKMKEIQELLLYSDWRLLPDAPQKVEGEREMWVKYRDELRSLMTSYDEYETPYQAFEYISKIKFPLDPRKYLEKYPNQEVEYLTTEDQYVKMDFMASNDWVAARITQISEFVDNYTPSEIVIRSKILKLLKELKIEQYFPFYDFEKYVKEIPE